jgi:hypothetical protein
MANHVNCSHIVIGALCLQEGRTTVLPKVTPELSSSAWSNSLERSSTTVPSPEAAHPRLMLSFDVCRQVKSLFALSDVELSVVASF